MNDMSNKEEIELIEDPVTLRTGDLSAFVRFNYPNGRVLELRVTVPNHTEDEFWRSLENLYFEKRDTATSDPQVLLTRVDNIKKKGKHKIKW